MAEKSQIFGSKLPDRISSPEQLNDAFKVTTPVVWILLGTVIAILAGFFVWASVGRFETLADADVIVKDSRAAAYITGSNADSIQAGMTLRIGDAEYRITDVGRDLSGRAVAYADVSEPDGEYSSKVVIESVRPISFLLQ